MYYRVLQDAEGYQAGDVLDLGDAELAAQIGRTVPLLKLAGMPKPVTQPVSVPTPTPPAPEPVAPVKRKPAKRGKRG